jgi:hypothetical protein
MDFIFRRPRFPVILDTGETLIHANSKAQLASKVAKIKFTDNENKDIIDAQADGFSLYPDKMFVAPAITSPRWTKLQIIELYNSKRQAGAPELRTTSLGNRSLAGIVNEVVELLSRK